MWLLKLHFSISILCLITFIGFMQVCRQNIKNNGWTDGVIKKKKSISFYLIFFTPIMNILTVIIMFFMISVKKKDFEKICEDAKKNNEVSDYERK